MAISRIGSATANTTNVTPAYVGAQAGDIELLWAYRSSAATVPTVPAGWTLLASGSGNTTAGFLAYRFCTSPENLGTGTATGATQVILVRYRGVKAIGNIATSNATGTSISYPSLTMVMTDGASWIVGVGGHRTATNVQNAPTGMTNVTSNSTHISAVHDTNGGVSSWAGASATVNASSGHESMSVELIAAHSGFDKYSSGTSWSVSTENKVAVCGGPGGSHTIIRAATARKFGKRAYLWRAISQGESFDMTAGLIAAGENMDAWPDNGAVFSFDIHDLGMFVEGDGDNSSASDLGAYVQAGDYGYAAFDLDAGKMWVCHQHMTDWNNDPTANPNSGTGGVSYTHAKGKWLFPFTGSGNNGSNFGLNTSNLNEQSPTWTFPSNASQFSVWDADDAALPSTLDATIPYTLVDLSTNHLTATQVTNVTTVGDIVRGTLSRLDSDTSVYVMKVTITNKVGSDSIGVGICNAAKDVTGGSYLGKTNDEYSWWDDGSIIWGDTTRFTIDTYTTGDVLYLAWDFVNRMFWGKVNSGNWNGSGTANPLTNTGGKSFASINSGPWYPAINMEGATEVAVWDGTSDAGLGSGGLPWDGASGPNSYTLTAASNTFTFSGGAANLLRGRLLFTAMGAFALNGQAATLRHNYPLAAARGTVAFSGQAAGLRTGRRLGAGQGTYALTGEPATLTYSGSSHAYSLTSAFGTFALDGRDVGLKWGRKASAAQGAFILFGQIAGLKVGCLLGVLPGGYTLSGQAATLKSGRRFVAGFGAFTLSGENAVLRHGPPPLIVGQGSYSLTGKAATLRSVRKIVAQCGTLALMGEAIRFETFGWVSVPTMPETWTEPISGTFAWSQAETEAATWTPKS